ncbi:hypothetical protein [Mycobacterium sp. MAA66]|uniref:hypothetical protein n=1 Tax=Mycobacterium sp. MAA66 TaxID=3156297 RepID=UPI0035165659
MVPELGRGTVAELSELSAAVRTAVATLPPNWLAIGVGAQAGRVAADAVGTFAGYGTDLSVTLRPDATGPVRDLPLCALIAGWLRGQANPDATAEVRVFADDLPPDAALAHGRDLRGELDGAGVLVVADGAPTLTPAAPGGFDPDSIALQQHWDDALAAGDVAALGGLTGVLGRVAYQVLAGLAGPDPQATQLYRGAPYGVGYFVGTWTVT